MPQKYEREIEEILRRIDAQLPKESLRRRANRRLGVIGHWLVERMAADISVNPGQLLAAGVILAVVSYLLQGLVPSLVGPAIMLALGLMVCALVLSIVNGRRRKPRIWRGRNLEYDRREPVAWEGLLKRLRDWRDRGRGGHGY